MDNFVSIVEKVNGAVNSAVWGPYMLLLIVGTGIFMTIGLKFFQVSKIALWMKKIKD